MKDRDYIVKKFVRAKTVAEAIRKERQTPVGEIYEATDKPDSHNKDLTMIGFSIPLSNEDE